MQLETYWEAVRAWFLSGSVVENSKNDLDCRAEDFADEHD